MNYHGSSGFGNAFLDSITHRWGELELKDIEAATDWLRRQPWVDKGRIFATGGSYGGFMVAWMNGHVKPGRYQAYVCHAGCFDWRAMYADDAYTWHSRELGANYWDDPAKIQSQSPDTFAARFATPTLVIHGALDYRVPDQQGLAYYNTLKARGIGARLVWFPDENHWILKPRNSRLWYGEFFAWLKAHDPAAKAGPAAHRIAQADGGGLRARHRIQRSRDDMDHDLPAYLRHPTIHGETIVFVADDDLWTVSAAGGVARRLTAGLSEPSTPCLSPDGKLLAFVGRDEQHPEVYVMPAEGGPARRLTWLGTDTLVRGWTPAGEIVYVTTQGQPFFRNHHAFVIAAAGGTPRPLPWGQVNHLAFGPGERKVIGRNTADPARWKRYRGGTAGTLWIDAEGSGSFRRMKELAGNLTSPMWLDGRVWFLGDGDGVGNLYSCRPDGSELRRHTDHEAFYARHAQTDGRRIVYQCGAKIRLFDPASESDREVEIRTPAHRVQAARKFVAAGEHLESFRLHPAGHSLALVARGQLFGMALWEGAPRRYAGAEAGRMRHGQWLGDGSTLVAVSDASGEERVVAFSGHEAKVLPWDTGHVTRMRAAPQGSRSPSPTIATRSGSATSSAASSTPSMPAPTAAATTSPGRPTAPGSPTPSPPAPGTSRSSCTRSPRTPARSSPSPSSATTRPRSIPTASTSTSCRCAPTTRSTTASSSR